MKLRGTTRGCTHLLSRLLQTVDRLNQLHIKLHDTFKIAYSTKAKRWGGLSTSFCNT